MLLIVINFFQTYIIKFIFKLLDELAIQDNKSINTIEELQNIEIKPDSSSNPHSIFISKITGVYFNQLKDNIFNKYKEDMRRKELEEIKIYNIKPKDGTFEVVTLKEKFVSFKF